MDLEASLDLKVVPAPQPAPTLAVPATEPSRPLLRLLVKQLLVCLVIVATAFGTFQFVTHFLLQSVQVVGASMSPTLHDSGRYVLNRWIFHVRDPEPKDIVVLRDPTDDCYAVKRIVAKQGDTVYVRDGHLFVNGKILNEPYLPPETPTYAAPRFREQMWICGVNQYFVLGDNRNNSADSRIYGAIPRQNILGLVTP